VSWDEALDFAARELLRIRAESGPAAIFHYRSGGSLGALKHLSDYFFEKFGPVTTKRGDICSGAGDEAQMLDFGEEDSHDIFDLLSSRNIILWGKNPVISSPHLVPVLKDARASKLLIDPVWHKTARLCDAFVQPRPGGDFSLAMARRGCSSSAAGRSRDSRSTATTFRSSARSRSRTRCGLVRGRGRVAGRGGGHRAPAARGSHGDSRRLGMARR